MPAPAVIPAPKAYINAVAVKGFVVELWAVSRETLASLLNPEHGACALAAREHPKQRPRKRHFPSTSTRPMCAEGRPRFLL